jgi:hypothetical protein
LYFGRLHGSSPERKLFRIASSSRLTVFRATQKTATLNISNILRTGRNQSRSRAETGQSAPPEGRVRRHDISGTARVLYDAVGSHRENRESITQTARTEKIGDGKIFVYSLEQVVSSRTDETGADAL